jgi:hypothetical protein
MEANTTITVFLPYLHNLDVSLLNTREERRADLLGPFKEQALRLQKWYVLRERIPIVI